LRCSSRSFTYLGGAVVKKGIRIAGKSGNKALKVVGKVALKQNRDKLAEQGSSRSLREAFKFDMEQARIAIKDWIQ